MRKTMTSMAAAIIGLWITHAHAQQPQPLAPAPDAAALRCLSSGASPVVGAGHNVKGRYPC